MLRGLLGGGPCTFDGRVPPRRRRGATTRPRSSSRRRRSSSGGKGDRLLSLVAELADGWNTCWVWTPDGVPRAARRARRARARPSAAIRRSVTRSLGLYTLCGEDERDLERRFDAPAGDVRRPGVLDGTTLDEWRAGPAGRHGRRRSGSRPRAGTALGVETLIVGVGAVPFAVTALDDVELLAEALRR